MTSSDNRSLPRVLGPWMAAAVVVGTVIGSGVFKKGRNVAELVPDTGPALLVWAVGGVLTLFGALALAEICVLFPRVGGNYAFLTEGYGRMAGFLWGWVEFGINRGASIAALAAMFAEGLADVAAQLTPGGEALPFWGRQAVAVGTILALAALNAGGTRLGARVQVGLTAVKVASIVGIALLPLAVWLLVPAPAHPPRLDNLRPVWPADPAAVNWGYARNFLVALVAVLWAYDGWMNIGPIAGEVRNPGRNLPLAAIGGVLALIALYVSANAAYLSVIPRADMANLRDTAVSTEFGLRLLGPVGAVLASGVLMVSVFGSLNGNLLVGPRLLFAMARDRLIPAGAGAVHPRTDTPVAATLVLAAWSVVILLAGAALTQYRLPALTLGGVTLDVNLPADKPLFDVVTDFAIFGTVAFGTLAVGTLFLFRRRFPVASHPLPYRCPGYPFVPTAYVVIMLGVLANMIASPEQRAEAVAGLVFIAAGAGVYAVWLTGRNVHPERQAGEPRP